MRQLGDPTRAILREGEVLSRGAQAASSRGGGRPAGATREGERSPRRASRCCVSPPPGYADWPAARNPIARHRAPHHAIAVHLRQDRSRADGAQRAHPPHDGLERAQSAGRRCTDSGCRPTCTCVGHTAPRARRAACEHGGLKYVQDDLVGRPSDRPRQARARMMAPVARVPAPRALGVRESRMRRADAGSPPPPPQVPRAARGRLITRHAGRACPQRGMMPSRAGRAAGATRESACAARAAPPRRRCG